MVEDQTNATTVLVIEDDESVREACRQTLEREGYRVPIAPDGEQGLRLVQRLKPDAALVDLRLPGIAGIDVLRRSRDIDPHLVLIVITGYGTMQSAIEAMRIGASDYLCKPFDGQLLLDAVGHGLQRRSAAPTRPRPAPGDQVDISSATAIRQILERAHRDEDFVARLTQQGSQALAAYPISPAEAAALISGDVRFIEGRIGKLTQDQRTWFTCRLQQEIW
jgi:DNA-binding NtrC family response regulator